MADQRKVWQLPRKVNIEEVEELKKYDNSHAKLISDPFNVKSIAEHRKARKITMLKSRKLRKLARKNHARPPGPPGKYENHQEKRTSKHENTIFTTKSVRHLPSRFAATVGPRRRNHTATERSFQRACKSISMRLHHNMFSTGSKQKFPNVLIDDLQCKAGNKEISVAILAQGLLKVCSSAHKLAVPNSQWRRRAENFRTHRGKMTENKKARTRYGTQSPFTPLLQEEKEKECRGHLPHISREVMNSQRKNGAKWGDRQDYDWYACDWQTSAKGDSSAASSWYGYDSQTPAKEQRSWCACDMQASAKEQSLGSNDWSTYVPGMVTIRKLLRRSSVPGVPVIGKLLRRATLALQVPGMVTIRKLLRRSSIPHVPVIGKLLRRATLALPVPGMVTIRKLLRRSSVPGVPVIGKLLRRATLALQVPGMVTIRKLLRRSSVPAWCACDWQTSAKGDSSAASSWYGYDSQTPAKEQRSWCACDWQTSAKGDSSAASSWYGYDSQTPAKEQRSWCACDWQTSAKGDSSAASSWYGYDSQTPAKEQRSWCACDWQTSAKEQSLGSNDWSTYVPGMVRIRKLLRRSSVPGVPVICRLLRRSKAWTPTTGVYVRSWYGYDSQTSSKEQRSWCACDMQASAKEQSLDSNDWSSWYGYDSQTPAKEQRSWCASGKEQSLDSNDWSSWYGKESLVVIGSRAGVFFVKVSRIESAGALGLRLCGVGVSGRFLHPAACSQEFVQLCGSSPTVGGVRLLS